MGELVLQPLTVHIGAEVIGLKLAEAVRDDACRWRWHEGDVVMWDERTTQHSGAADHAGQDRVLRRVLVTGDKPA